MSPTRLIRITYYSWMLLTIIFCTINSILFYFSLRKPISELADIQQLPKSNEESNPHLSHFAETNNLIRRAVGRIMWYCLVPLMSQGFMLISELEYRLRNPHDSSYWIWYLGDVLAGAQVTYLSSLTGGDIS